MVVDNFSGYPSMTIPMGYDGDLPLGLNISAKAFDEKTMFAYGEKMEALIAWKGKF